MNPYRAPAPRDDYTIAPGVLARLANPARPHDLGKVVIVLAPSPSFSDVWVVSLGCFCCRPPAACTEDLVRIP